MVSHLCSLGDATELCSYGGCMPDRSSVDLWLHWLLCWSFLSFSAYQTALHFVHKYLWDVTGISCDKLRFPFVLSGGCEVRMFQMVFLQPLATTVGRSAGSKQHGLSEGGNQHNRRRTTRGIFERRWPTLRQASGWLRMSLRCSEQRLRQRRSDPHCIREGWWTASMRCKLWCHCSWKSAKYQAICVDLCLHCLDLKNS